VKKVSHNEGYPAENHVATMTVQWDQWCT